VLIGRWIATRQPYRVLGVQAGLLALIGLAGALAASRLAVAYPEYAAYVPWLEAAALTVLVTSIGALVLARRRHLTAVVGLLALGGLAGTQIATVGHRTLSSQFSVASTIAQLPAPVPADARVFAVNSYDHTMPWYLRRTVTMVGYKDELTEAIAWEPQKYIAELPDFARAWSAAPSAYAFIALRDLELVRGATGLPLEVVARGPRYVIVRKP
jgi:hypothetical protein